MKETPSSKPSTPASHSSHSSNVDEEYQVDNISTASSRDSDDDNDNTIVVSNEPSLPHIESVSVVNSNDVHIGNKTVYQGPVTIKQIVYPNGAITSGSVDDSKDCENKLNVKLNGPSATEGIDNPTFVKDCSVQYRQTPDKNAIRNNNASSTLSGVAKGFLCLENVPKKFTSIVIVVFLLIIVIIIIFTLIYRRQPGLSEGNRPYGDTDEQENNTPVDYSSDSNSTINERLRIVPRLQWLAQPPTDKANLLKTPVPLVIIQHTATESCISLAQCIYQVRHIQQFHIESNQWWDIGYNFLVGGDGAAYEGRGWKYEGAHTFGYNYLSIGVGFIGTFNTNVPPKNQIAAFKKLITKGVELGYVREDYKILAARQLYATESPGAAFIKEIETWPHWAKQP